MSSLLTPVLTESERTVLDIIWRLGPIARQQIAGIAHMSAMTVSRVTRSLTEKAMVVDAPERTGASGNPVRPLSINAQSGFSVGVNFTQTAIEIGVLDLAGSLLEHEVLRDAPDRIEALGDRVGAILKKLHARGGRFAAEKLVGVGFALPGDFAEKGRVLAAHPLFAKLRSRDLSLELAEALGAPVYLNSDSNSAAVGERLLGAGRNLRTFLYVHLGHGVGGGLVLEGRPYFGVHMNAGILGNHFPLDKPRPSGLDFLATLQKAGRPVSDFVDLEGLPVMDFPETRAWIKRAGAQLRDKLNYAVKLIDPEAVVIGGRLPDQINHALAVEIDRPDFLITCEMDKFLPRPRVLGSLLGARAGMIGAAALPIHNMLFGADNADG